MGERVTGFERHFSATMLRRGRTGGQPGGFEIVGLDRLDSLFGMKASRWVAARILARHGCVDPKHRVRPEDTRALATSVQAALLCLFYGIVCRGVFLKPSTNRFNSKLMVGDLTMNGKYEWVPASITFGPALMIVGLSFGLIIVRMGPAAYSWCPFLHGYRRCWCPSFRYWSGCHVQIACYLIERSLR